MTDRPSRIRATLLTKYYRWAWHWRRDGTLWIRNKETGRVIDVGRVAKMIWSKT